MAIKRVLTVKSIECTSCSNIVELSRVFPAFDSMPLQHVQELLRKFDDQMNGDLFEAYAHHREKECEKTYERSPNRD